MYFNDTATTVINTLSLHDALPILLEVVCARLLLPSASDTEAALLQRVERIETRLDLSIPAGEAAVGHASAPDRKSTRLNSSHVEISYAVFCLKKKKNRQ